MPGCLRRTAGSCIGRVAQALEHMHAADPNRISAQLAAHYDQAGVADQAAGFYQRAAEVAQRVYANQEAIGLLNRAVVLQNSQPPSQERDEQDLALHTALGVSLVATRGYGADEVMAVYRRSHDLAQRVGHPPDPPVLRALAIASISRADFQQAHDLGDELLSLAERDRDPALLVEAHYVLGVTLFWKGAFAAARSHLEEALAHYRRERSQVHVNAYAQDPGVVCLIRLAVVLWFLGEPELAARRADESLALARQVAHPFSLGYALAWDTLLHTLRGDAGTAHGQADATIALSREHGLDLWLAMATVLRGWALAENGDVEAGIDALHEGMRAFQATGARYKRPYFLGLLAEQSARAGRLELGLSILDEALAVVQDHGERCWEAHLYWCKGELLLLAERGDGQAKLAFRTALALARQQGARAIELRAAAGLSRLGG
jgi:predicted ATPase